MLPVTRVQSNPAAGIAQSAPPLAREDRERRGRHYRCRANGRSKVHRLGRGIFDFRERLVDRGLLRQPLEQAEWFFQLQYQAAAFGGSLEEP